MSGNNHSSRTGASIRALVLAAAAAVTSAYALHKNASASPSVPEIFLSCANKNNGTVIIPERLANATRTSFCKDVRQAPVRGEKTYKASSNARFALNQN